MAKVVAIIQARMGSTRLPGKVMMKLADKTVLGHVITRVMQAEKIDEIVIATTTHKRDNPIVEEAEKYHVNYFRGSEEDVLSRYYHAAREYEADVIVRITSDCPLIDPKLVDDIVVYFLHNNHTLVTNAGHIIKERTYPRGMDAEVFSINILKEAYLKASESYQREHVTPYIYEKRNDIYIYKNEQDLSRYRLTLDTEEDYKLLAKIYDHLYNKRHDFYLEDIIRLLQKYPRLYLINSDVNQKRLMD